MNYTIELNKEDMKMLKRLIRGELIRIEQFVLTHGEDHITSKDKTQLLLIAGKLNNVITVADKITVE